MKRNAVSIPLVLLLVGAACGGESPPPPCPPSLPTTQTRPGLIRDGAPGQAEGAPTALEAKKFVEQVDADLRRLWVARDRAAWANETNINEDTDKLAAAGEEATSEYVTKAIQAAVRFDHLDLPPDVRRQLYLLKIAQLVPAPSNARERGELAETQTSMKGTYGKGKYCPPRLHGKCLTLDELSDTLEKSRKYDEILEAWTGWHTISPGMRETFARYVELGNRGAKEIGFADMGALWRAGYDMSPADFEADLERLWGELKPLYEELHCYVRSKLRAKYGKDKIGTKSPIPAHLLGNMWAQEWENIYDLVEPNKGEASLDVSKRLVDKKTKPEEMVRLGEKFFTSLGFDPLPDTFWKRSQFTRPRDREVVCHASAWDVGWNNDLRIKMCIEPKERDLITIHHELGHDFYFSRYYKLPILFQQGANDGFHEGIGDTLALSVTPAYLKGIGLLDRIPNNPRARINQQMKGALSKIAFLPFGLVIDKWRWDVFSGKVPKEKYNEAWWALRTKYQGIAPPVSRSEADFDPGAKYHVPASVPYIRYFLALVYQFQFHRALCKAAGHTGPIQECSIYGSKDAGQKLMAMLSLGASKPWPEALALLSGETKADATAVVEYFAPLRTWLQGEIKGETCGW